MAAACCAQGQSVLFMETALDVQGHRRHATMDAIPMSDAVLEKAKGYFKKGLQEAESEWSTHAARAVIDTTNKKVRGQEAGGKWGGRGDSTYRWLEQKACLVGAACGAVMEWAVSDWACEAFMSHCVRAVENRRQHTFLLWWKCIGLSWTAAMCGTSFAFLCVGFALEATCQFLRM